MGVRALIERERELRGISGRMRSCVCVCERERDSWREMRDGVVD